MSDVETCEVLIVGGGKSGKTLAADLGRSSRDVILIERGTGVSPLRLSSECR